MAALWTPEQALADPVSKEVIQEATAAGVPLHLRHFLWHSRDGKHHADILEYVYRVGGFSGYDLYEAGAMHDLRSLGSDGKLQYYPGVMEELRKRVESLGLL